MLGIRQAVERFGCVFLGGISDEEGILLAGASIYVAPQTGGEGLSVLSLSRRWRGCRCLGYPTFRCAVLEDELARSSRRAAATRSRGTHRPAQRSSASRGVVRFRSSLVGAVRLGELWRIGL